jgi:hypothetical protein
LQGDIERAYEGRAVAVAMSGASRKQEVCAVDELRHLQGPERRDILGADPPLISG